MSLRISPDKFIETWGGRRRGAGLPESVAAVELSAGLSFVSLDRIEVNPSERGRGISSRLLRLLTRLSNECRVDIEVIPRSLKDGAMRDEDLAARYQRHGFVLAPTDDIPRLMRRGSRAG